MNALTNLARPQSNVSCRMEVTPEMTAVFNFETLLDKYREVDSLVAANWETMRFIADRKVFRPAVSRMHNRYQVCNSKHELIAVCRKLSEAKRIQDAV